MYLRAPFDLVIRLFGIELPIAVLLARHGPGAPITKRPDNGPYSEEPGGPEEGKKDEGPIIDAEVVDEKKT